MNLSVLRTKIEQGSLQTEPLAEKVRLPARGSGSESRQNRPEEFDPSAPMLGVFSALKSSANIFTSLADATESARDLALADQSDIYTLVPGRTQFERVGAVRGCLGANAIFFGANDLDVVRMVRPERAANIFMYGANELEMPSIILRAPGTYVSTIAPNELEKLYVFEDRSSVNTFILEHRLRGLLAAASDPLNAAFGITAIKILKLVSDEEEDSQTLHCIVLVTASVEEARRSLESFDEQWWLANCGAVDGKLNFDFEFV